MVQIVRTLSFFMIHSLTCLVLPTKTIIIVINLFIVSRGQMDYIDPQSGHCNPYGQRMLVSVLVQDHSVPIRFVQSTRDITAFA